MHVRFNDKKVLVLYDYLGNNPDNAAYGPSMIQYLVHMVALNLGITNQSHLQWATQWLVLSLDNSPCQMNSYNCGIFTMTTGALLSQGCIIDRHLYTQNDLY